MIFSDQDCEKLNCIWLYDSVGSIITDTKGLIKYTDVNKKTRIYKTAKSFFRVLKISSTDRKKYFK
jgi:hypothetical protein